MSEREFGDLLADSGFNAGLAWGLVGVIAVGAVESVLTSDLLWAAFACLVGGIVVLPAIAFRDPRAMPPWEIVLVGGLPVLGRSLATLQVTNDVATYLSVAALALLLAVDLHLFTDVEMSVGFAILFVVVATLGTAGLWAVARWLSDLYLGTSLLLDPALTRPEIEHELMIEFVGSAVAGLIAGFVFEWYVRRRTTIVHRLPEEV